MQLRRAPRWLVRLARPLSLSGIGRRRNRIEVPTDRLWADLRDGIANDQLRPFYQPILELRTGKLIGFESLARWQHPQLGMVSPILFIPIAEDLDAINELSFTLLARSCRDIRFWPEHLGLSINISPMQLSDRDLPAKLIEILEEGRLAPERLTVELTEGALVSDLDSARQALTALRSHGIKLALDDFGAGYTNLKYLNELPFDRIKIDRSFIGTIDGFTGRMIVRSIVTLAQSLSMHVTAEGVETSGQATILGELGCDHGQGFLFGRPMPAAAAQRMVEARFGTALRRAAS